MKRAIALLGSVFLSVCLSSLHAEPTVEYIHTDALGTPIAVTDENGNVIERYEYEPYGLQVSGPVTNGPGYTGHVEDAATGLTYMQQRYYDPQIGRFLSVDPVGPLSGKTEYFNRYWYAGGNPYKNVDPDGRCFGPLLVPCIVYGPAAADAAFVVGSALLGAVLIEDAVNHMNNENGQTSENGGVDDSSTDKPASSPNGQRGSPIEVEPGTNTPAEINGRQYTGHAQDRMQGRGITPSAVEEAILNGESAESRGGTTTHTDKNNGVEVVTNSDGDVVTVKHIPRENQ